MGILQYRGRHREMEDDIPSDAMRLGYNVYIAAASRPLHGPVIFLAPNDVVKQTPQNYTPLFSRALWAQPLRRVYLLLQRVTVNLASLQFSPAFVKAVAYVLPSSRTVSSSHSTTSAHNLALTKLSVYFCRTFLHGRTASDNFVLRDSSPCCDPFFSFLLHCLELVVSKLIVKTVMHCQHCQQCRSNWTQERTTGLDSFMPSGS